MAMELCRDAPPCQSTPGSHGAFATSRRCSAQYKASADQSQMFLFTIKGLKRISKPSGLAQLLVRLPAFSKRGEARVAGWSGGSREATRYLSGGFMTLMWICSTFNWNSLRIHGAENVRRSGNEGFERPNVSCK